MASLFSEYRIVSELGEGGFGKVSLGVHKVTNEKVALKFVNASAYGNAESIDMVYNEAETLKKLQHPNIVKIKNTFALKNMQMVFIMEYLEGGELLDYVMKRERLPEKEAKGIFRQMASAIQYCHRESLIHRDLKMENILLVSTTTNKIKVRNAR